MRSSITDSSLYAGITMLMLGRCCSGFGGTDFEVVAARM